MDLGSNRPRIPAETVREVLVEAGHRCAVCGEQVPLDRAHIRPWRTSRSHKAEDLICLCANCHRRADTEKWSQKTLREYKKRPWVTRRFEARTGQTSGLLRLSADLLDGAAKVTGGGHVDGVRFKRWEAWLEVYFAPSERTPASIPIHRITGSLQVGGVSSLGFEDVTLTTSYDLPPHVLSLLYGRQSRLKQLVVSDPIHAVLVAYGQIPEWSNDGKDNQDAIRVNFDIADEDYEPLEIFAKLRSFEYEGLTQWRLEDRGLY